MVKPSVDFAGRLPVFADSRIVVLNAGIIAFVAGADVNCIVTDMVSELTPRNAWVIVLVTWLDPTAIVVVAEPRVNVSL